VLLLRVKVALVHELLDGNVGHVGVDGIEAESAEEAKMVHLPGDTRCQMV
jgi:hypothetical protein